jgi:2,7-dihydroxy-5-methyl-1-naphthoate 7-O-methyltransferase
VVTLKSGALIQVLNGGLVSMSEQYRVDIGALSDLRTPWCIHVAATLRIAEHIADGKHDISDLAAAAGCDPYALHRILTHLVSKGVFEEAAPGYFALNEAGESLLDPALHIGLDLGGIGGRMAHGWGTLLTYTRTGRSGYEEIFHMPFWEDLNAHPEVGESFDALMGPLGHGRPNPNFEITGRWSSIKRIVDVGGGAGAMLAEVLRLRPEIHGTLVDFPRTVAVAEQTFKAAGVADRATVSGQSFFDPLPGGADLYLLKKVLNDWPDREAVAILTRCAEAARPGGRVIVLGGVVVDANVPRPVSIDMVLTGGKSRTVAEFASLARQAGLEIISAEQQPSGHFVTECRLIPT